MILTLGHLRGEETVLSENLYKKVTKVVSKDATLIVSYNRDILSGIWMYGTILRVDDEFGGSDNE